MKLQTRIIWIACMAVFITTIISDTLLWNMNRKLLIQEALEASYRTTYENWLELENNLLVSGVSDTDSNAVLYFVKNEKNDYLICVSVIRDSDNQITWNEEIFNHTVLTAEDILQGDFLPYGQMSYLWHRYGNQDFLIFETEYNHITFYWLTDVTYVRNRLHILALAMIGITLAITAIMSAILFCVMRKAFVPLHELAVSAKSIADGDYESRIQIRKQDEIGTLAENFNQMVEAVWQRTRSLEESEQKKTLFMGSLTHELKTPMTAISGYAETLLMAKLEPEEEEAALQYIYTECGRLERLSQKMMHLLELDQSAEWMPEEHSVRELFEAAKNSCDPVLQKRNIRLQMEEHGERFIMDLDLMTDAIINLIDNAAKASEDGSEIFLKAGADENGHVYILTEDFGCGIPEEEQKKILEPFYMVDKSRSRKYGGAGLGLALTKRILERHHMQLGIESEVGQGTRITIRLQNDEYLM